MLFLFFYWSCTFLPPTPRFRLPTPFPRLPSIPLTLTGEEADELGVNLLDLSDWAPLLRCVAQTRPPTKVHSRYAQRGEAGDIGQPYLARTFPRWLQPSWQQKADPNQDAPPLPCRQFPRGILPLAVPEYPPAIPQRCAQALAPHWGKTEINESPRFIGDGVRGNSGFSYDCVQALLVHEAINLDIPRLVVRYPNQYSSQFVQGVIPSHERAE